MAETIDTEHRTEPETRQRAHSLDENIDPELGDSFLAESYLEQEPAGFKLPTQNKVNIVQDNRGVGDLQLLFPHVRTEVLTRLMQYYGSYTAVVDVLRALGDQLDRRPLTARFWDRQYWPRPGQLPSVFSWSVVDSMESYDVVHGHDVEKEEEDEWLDDMDEHEFGEILRKAGEHGISATAAGSDDSFEDVFSSAAKPEPARSIPTVRYSEVLQRTSKSFTSAPPRIPPLTHLHPMRTIAEDEEFDVSSDSEDDGIDSIVYRERYVMKSMVSANRRHGRIHVDPDVLAKKQQRAAQRLAAMR